MIEPIWFAVGVGGSMLVLSVLSMGAMAWDKRAARRGGWRVRETTLHLFELLGGWPGSLFASAMWRHKSRKAGYRLLRFVAIVCHAAAVAALWLILGREP